MTHDDELRELRERAYGPQPDVSLTAADRERLQALEHPMPAPTVAVTAVVASNSDQLIASPPLLPNDTQPTSFPHTSRVPSIRESPQGRRSLRLLWAGTAVAVCLTAIAALILTPRPQAAPFSPTARQVARLSADLDGSAPGFFASFSVSPANAVVFDRYADLSIVVTQPAGASPGQSCLYVYDGGAIDSTTSGLRSGQVFTGCSAGAFPAAVQFVVSGNQSTAVRSVVSIGSALQFVYDEPDNQVVVFLNRQ